MPFAWTNIGDGIFTTTGKELSTGTVNDEISYDNITHLPLQEVSHKSQTMNKSKPCTMIEPIPDSENKQNQPEWGTVTVSAVTEATIEESLCNLLIHLRHKDCTQGLINSEVNEQMTNQIKHWKNVCMCALCMVWS